jgi:hypothetical protein
MFEMSQSRSRNDSQGKLFALFFALVNIWPGSHFSLTFTDRLKVTVDHRNSSNFLHIHLHHHYHHLLFLLFAVRIWNLPTRPLSQKCSDHSWSNLLSSRSLNLTNLCLFESNGFWIIASYSLLCFAPSFSIVRSLSLSLSLLVLLNLLWICRLFLFYTLFQSAYHPQLTIWSFDRDRLIAFNFFASINPNKNTWNRLFKMTLALSLSHELRLAFLLLLITLILQFLPFLSVAVSS